MKLKNNLFLIGSILCGLLPLFEAEAKKCDVGNFLVTSYCYYCRPGCYCEGSPDGAKLDPRDKISISKNDDSGNINQWCLHKTNTCPFAGSDGYGQTSSKGGNQCGKSDTARIYRCPDAFPSSDASAKSINDCYLQCTPPGGTQRFNYSKDKIHCNPGYALNFRQSSCVECKKANGLTAQSYCPGGDFYPSCIKNQGVQECTDGKSPNAERTKCVTAAEKCPGNKILKDNKCEDCTGGKVPNNDHTKCVSTSDKCPGSNQIAVGDVCSTCSLGTKPNDEHTECVTDKKSVPAGKYLPKGKTTPAECKGRENTTYYYCPGGDYIATNDGDQGIFKCASGEIANDEKTGCSKWIKQSKMQECWLLIDNPEKFRECVVK